MQFFRHLARDLQFAAMLVCAFALAGLAGARMAGHHASKTHALAALHVVCSEHGLSLSADTEKDGHTHSGCPCGPACTFKTFGVIAMAPIGPAWSIAADGAVILNASSAAPPPARALPSVSARGPPILI